MQENVFVVEASFTMPISAGIKTKSALNATRRVTKGTNVAVTVNQVVEMAENLKHPSHGDNRRGGGRRIHIASHDHQGERKGKTEFTRAWKWTKVPPLLSSKKKPARESVKEIR